MGSLLNKSKYFDNYLVFFALVPLALDVMYHHQNWGNLGGLWACFFILVTLTVWLKSGSIEIKINNQTLLISMIIVSLLVTIIVKENFGYFTYIYLIFLGLILFKFPIKKKVDECVKVLILLIYLCIIFSLIAELVWQPNILSQNPIRHPWVELLGFRINRISGIFSGPGLLGLLSALIIFYASYKQRIASYVAQFTAWVCLFLTDTRAAFLALFLTTVIIYCKDMLMGRGEEKNNHLVILAITIIYFITLGWTSLSTSFPHRLQIWSYVANEVKSTYQSPVPAIKNESSHSVKEKPTAQIPYLVPYSHTHNYFFEIFQGLSKPLIATRLLIFFFIIWLIIGSIKSSKNRETLGLVLCIFIFSMFDLGLSWSRLTIVNILFLTALLRCSVEDTDNNSKR